MKRRRECPPMFLRGWESAPPPYDAYARWNREHANMLGPCGLVPYGKPSEGTPAPGPDEGEMARLETVLEEFEEGARNRWLLELEVHPAVN